VGGRPPLCRAIRAQVMTRVALARIKVGIFMV
jgi:hypothetical protein